MAYDEAAHSGWPRRYFLPLRPTPRRFDSRIAVRAATAPQKDVGHDRDLYSPSATSPLESSLLTHRHNTEPPELALRPSREIGKAVHGRSQPEGPYSSSYTQDDGAHWSVICVGE